jgi:hypothetical protein
MKCDVAAKMKQLKGKEKESGSECQITVNSYVLQELHNTVVKHAQPRQCQ